MKPLLNVSALHQACRPGPVTHTPIFWILLSKQVIDQGTVLHEMVHPMNSQFSVSHDRGTEFQEPKGGRGHHQRQKTDYHERRQPWSAHEAIAEDAHRCKGQYRPEHIRGGVVNGG